MVVNTPTRAGRILRFGKESFAYGDYRRAYGTNIPYVSSRYDSVPYALEQEVIAYELPEEIIENAGNGPAQIDLRKVEAKNAMSRLMNSYEVKVAQLVTTSASYETSCYSANFGALIAGSSSGIAGANGIAGVIAAKRAVADQIGIRPNSMVIGSAVYDALLTSTEILDRIKYTSADSISLDIISRYFGLERGIRVADGRVLDITTSKLVPYFPQNAILLFYSPGSASNSVMPAAGADMATPAFAYSYQLNGTPQMRPEYYIRERRVFRGELTVERSCYLTGLGETGKIGSGYYVADALTGD